MFCQYISRQVKTHLYTPYTQLSEQFTETKHVRGHDIHVCGNYLVLSWTKVNFKKKRKACDAVTARKKGRVLTSHRVTHQVLTSHRLSDSPSSNFSQTQ